MEEKIETAFTFGNNNISFLETNILAAFFPEAKEMTINEIKKRCNYKSYERIYSGLKSLVDKGIISEKRVGKTLVYSINLDNIYSEIVGFSNYMLNRRIEFMEKHKVLSKVINEIKENENIIILILFGSYSKGKENKKSDVDLLIVNMPGSEEAIERIIDSYNVKYGFNISPVIIGLDEFLNIKKENKELWSDLKKYGITFKGSDYVYWVMYKDERS